MGELKHKPSVSGKLLASTAEEKVSQTARAMKIFIVTSEVGILDTSKVSKPCNELQTGRGSLYGLRPDSRNR